MTRICAAPGCETFLSRFNPGELCAPCAPHFVPAPVNEPREPMPKKRTRIDPAVGDKRKLRTSRATVPLTDETAPPALGELCNVIGGILKGMLSEG